MSDCCAPNGSRPTHQPLAFVPAAAAQSTATSMVEIPAGSFLMGSEDEFAYPADGEAPVREVTLSPFTIDVHTVTNDEFAGFVENTGYVTDAERYGWSFVFAGLLPDEFPLTRGSVDAPWWREVLEASWRHPEGPQSTLDERADHPVVHVSWADASAYASWAGKRLPSEAQWERAARGGLEGASFPWGDELTPGNEHLMNVWQGVFPSKNAEDDGWYGTCPASAFPPNGFGLHNMTGNVWEWCADWFEVSAQHQAGAVDPGGAQDGDRKTLKGGSFLCHASYCRRYRPAARMALTIDSTSSNVGFRCVSAAEA